MKKIIAAILSIILIGSSAFAISSSTSATKPANITFMDYVIENYSIQVPSNWTSDTFVNEGIEYHRFFRHPILNRFAGFLYMYIIGFGYSIDLNVLGDSAYDYYFMGLGATNIRRETISALNKPAVIWTGYLKYDDNITRPVCGFVCIDKDLCFNLFYVDTSADIVENLNIVRYISQTFKRYDTDETASDLFHSFMDAILGTDQQ